MKGKTTITMTNTTPTPDDYREADALTEQAAALADRLGKLEDRPPLPATSAELRKRASNPSKGTAP